MTEIRKVPRAKVRFARTRRSTSGCATRSSHSTKAVERDGGDDHQGRDRGRVEPVEPLALIEGDLERADARHQEREPDPVEPEAGRALAEG